MEAVTNAFALLSAVVLGLTAGALLAEGAILVPFWRSLQPESFLGWYREHAARLQKFFGPLEVAAGVLTIAAAVLNWGNQASVSRLLVVSALLTIAVLAVFPLYFQQANASFAAPSLRTASPKNYAVGRTGIGFAPSLRRLRSFPQSLRL